MAFCRNCGAQVNDFYSVCPACGTRQAGSSPEPKAAETGHAAASQADYAQPINQSPIHKAQYNLLCILGLVISLISLVFNYFGLVGLGGFPGGLGRRLGRCLGLFLPRRFLVPTGGFAPLAA